MKDKVVIITGGSRGIGKATVNYFLENDYQVVTSSTTGKLDYSHPNLTVYQFDLGDQLSRDSFVKSLKSHGKIDCLINNAWWSAGRKTESSVDISLLQQGLTTNLIGTIDLTQKTIPLMNNNSVIINIASEYGSLTEDWGFVAPSYRIAKAGLNMFTRNIYQHQAITEANIKVYSFDPGWVKTDMGGLDAPRDPSEPAKELFDLYLSDSPTGEFYRGLVKRSW
ncbi:SDR family NAD(P)-dependent oxidoreductase [Candidatus Shapirobacteria bacterium]|nr:SDR family NAD(P)-dependent oxidoreductase [Candidatus Shapirobacteria bacterium]